MKITSSVTLAAIITVALLFIAQPSIAQTNWFQFKQKQEMPLAGTYQSIYRIPADSVKAIVYGNRKINYTSSWMQQQTFVVPGHKVDSLFNTNIEPGYYLIASAVQSNMMYAIKPKPAFTTNMVDMRDLVLLDVRDDENKPLNTATVMLSGKVLPYNALLRGYVVDADNKDLLEVRKDNYIVYYNCLKTRNRRQRSNSYNYGYNDEPQMFYKGYFVTNQPKYMPGDTVKYKAYIIHGTTNEPAKEPVKLQLGNYYQNYAIHTLTPQEPGVYYGEFVLGDSIKPDKQYNLNLTGTVTGSSMMQRIVVEDYLLDETFLRVTGENLKTYQPNDSVNIYAFAYNSNSLPVLDGVVHITVLPSGFDLKNDSTIFIPDTLYHASIPVNPEGETNIGFSTKGFPVLKSLSFKCIVTLVNSNFEQKDTSFVLRYADDERYLRVAEFGNKIRVEVISNKQSVAGKGYYMHGRYKKQIVYPAEITIDEGPQQYTFALTGDTGAVVNTYSHYLSNDSLAVYDDYRLDTAYMQVSNPRKIRFRYVLYSGNRFVGYGVAQNDTLIKQPTKDGATVTMLVNYTWQGQQQNRSYTAAKMDRSMFINVKKKDIVYPGQMDTIGIELTTVDGKPIKQTNITVLAFTAKFKEDFTPQMPYSGFIKPGLGEAKYSRSFNLLSYSSNKGVDLISRDLASVTGIDTVFFYNNIYLSPTNVAWYLFDIPESPAPQLAVYIREGNGYVQPNALYIDGNPVYLRSLSSSNDPNALYVSEGQHTVQFRTGKALYTIMEVTACKGVKTNLFINADSFDAKKFKDRHPFIYKEDMPDTLSYNERDVWARSVILYRSEYAGNYSFSQGLSTFYAERGYGRNTVYNNYQRNGYQSVRTFGPVNINDSVGFFEPMNVKMRFVPELHFIYTLRPGMMRLEKQSVYDYLKGKLAHNNHLPECNVVASVPLNFDSAQVMPPEQPVVSNRTHMAYDISEATASLIKDMPVANLVMRFQGGRFPKYIIARSLLDTVKPVIINQQRSGNRNSIALMPGKYQLLFLWTDTTATWVNDLVLPGNGSTHLYARDDSTAFKILSPPKWLRPYVSVTYDSGGRVNISTYAYKGQHKNGQISGNVMDEKIEPVIGAIVEILQGGVVKGGSPTDVDGNYNIHPLHPGKYDVRISYQGYKTMLVRNVQVSADSNTYLTAYLQFNTHNLNEVIVTSYKAPLIDRYSPGASYSRSSSEIEKMPTRTTNSYAPTSQGVYSSSDGLQIGGARTDGTLYIIDGVQVRGRSGMNLSQNTIDVESNSERNKTGSRKFLKSDKAQQFMAEFLNNMQAASGLRKEFRDWAIWEPNLWTDDNGHTSFKVKYPDDLTAWKTYVLAMNPKGFSGKAFRLTRAFKPLSAELSAPRFLRYGDSVEMVGKVMNYTAQPFKLTTTFINGDKKRISDSGFVNNAKVEQLLLVAPAVNSTDTIQLAAAYTITTDNGYTDGEQRAIPVLPVGVLETKGDFITMMRDTSVFSKPADSAGYFTGKTTIMVDGSLLEVMLREVENLKVYPHGCVEQLTTKLLAIYYEEEIKKLLGIDTLNNKKEKKEIIDKLVFAQHRDGSFGWFSGNSTDHRVTNYVVNTLWKVNKDRWLDFIVRRGLDYLNNNLDKMEPANKIAAMSTLSMAGYASSFKSTLDGMPAGVQTMYNRAAIIKIKKEQQLPYRNDLDTLMQLADESVNGISWGSSSYDWYRDPLPTTLLVYQLVSGDSVYGKRKDEILKYLLFKRNKGYYGNTAESGLVLTTLLPELLKNNIDKKSRKTEVYISGAIKDTVSTFPAYYSLNNKTPYFHFQKKGFSPAYVSVNYEYFNKQPKKHNGAFKVQTYFVKNRDTIANLIQGDRVVLRTYIECTKDAEYVMVDMPIPAGCVQANKNRGSYVEANREHYKDRTVIYCNRLRKGVYVFDVELQARYKGSFSVNPASASMMYYPEQYGNNEVKRIGVR